MNYIAVFLAFITLQSLTVQWAEAKVVVAVGDGRSAWSNSTTYFYNADDVNRGRIIKYPDDVFLTPGLSEKIVTPNGSIIERFDDPNRGLIIKDPNGLMWTTTLVASRPSITPFIEAELVLPGQGVGFCKKIGARLPTLKEFQSLVDLFRNQSGKFDAR